MNNVNHTIARRPPELTKSALAFPDCRIAPSKSDGKQLNHTAPNAKWCTASVRKRPTSPVLKHGSGGAVSLTCPPPPPAAPALPPRPPQLPPPRPPLGRRRRRTCRTWPHTGAARGGGAAAAAASPARGVERREAGSGGGGGGGQGGRAGARAAAPWSPLLRRAVQGIRGREQRTVQCSPAAWITAWSFW